MPQPALHLAIADDLQDRWTALPESAPIDPNSDLLRSAFRLGALGPDMGYFPGSPVRELSEVVHAGGAMDIARALHESGCALNRAYALGWTTHVLADVRIHPLINMAAAELPGMDCGREPADAERLVAHIRVELGIEAHYGRRRRLAPRRIENVFDEVSVRTLATAVRDILGLDVTAPQLLAAHRAAATCAPLCEHLSGLLANDLRDPDTLTAADFLRLPGVRRIVSRLVPRTSPLIGFLNPVRPPQWLIARVDAELQRLPLVLERALLSGLRELPDHDLNDGRPVASPAIQAA